MIAHAFLAITLVFPQTVSTMPARDPWISPDKAKHFLIAGFVESASFASFEAVGVKRSHALAGAVALTAAIALGRELHDKRTRNELSYRDLTWDFAGALVAYVMLRHTQQPSRP